MTTEEPKPPRGCWKYALFASVLAALILLSAAGWHELQIDRAITNKAFCIGHLKNIGLSLQMYRSEPYYSTWPTIDWSETEDSPDARARELGLLYDSGKGLLSEWVVFQCPSAEPRVDPRPGTIDTAAECDYMWIGSFGLTGDVPSNKIIAADRHGNHEDGWNCLYVDGHVKFHTTDNPDDDADPGSIFEKNDPPELDTWLR